MSRKTLGDFLRRLPVLLRGIRKRRLGGELDGAERKYRALFEQARDSILVLEPRPDGGPVIRDANAAALRAHGYSRDELIGQPISFLDEEADSADLAAERGRWARGAEGAAFEARHRRKDGSVFVAEVQVMMVDIDGMRVGISIERDITERKRMEKELGESELRFRSLFDVSRDALMTLEPPSWAFTSANPAAIVMYRAQGEADFISRAFWKLSPERQPDGRASADKAREMIETAMRNGFHIFEWAHDRFDGKEFVADVLLTRVDSGGKAFLRALIRDVTERKQGEAALRESGQRLDLALQAARMGVWNSEVRADRLVFDAQACRLLGLDFGRFSGTAEEFFNAVHPEDRSVLRVALAVAQHGAPYEVEYRVVWPDGSIHQLGSRGRLQQDEAGRPVRVNGVIWDVTERKQAEDSLRRLNRELRILTKCNEALVRAEDEPSLLNDICRIVCDHAGYHMAWVGYAENNAAKTVRSAACAGDEHGYVEQLRVTWADTERGRGPSGTAIRSGKIVCIPDFVTDPATAPWHAGALQSGIRSSIGLPLKDENANTFGALTIYSTEPNAFIPDGTRLLEELADDLAFGIMALRARIERKRAEAALQESESRFRSLVELSPEGIFVQSGGRFTYLNPAACRLFGVPRDEDLLGREFMDRIAPDYRDLVRERIRFQLETGNPAPLRELHFLRMDLSRILVETTAVPIRYQGQDAHLVFMHDISERKQAAAERERLQAQLVQSQRMESVGRLAGGVAHDFNNLLTAIKGYGEFVLGALTADDPKWADVTEILGAADRAAALTRQLLAFSRRQILSPEVVDINGIVDGIAKLLRRLIGEDVRLAINLAPVACLAKVDSGQIEQVVMNLAINARDAMPDGGVITLETGIAALDDEFFLEHPDLQRGPLVCLSVRDTGCGMTEEVKRHIFEPFYTTKQEGKGTGLGLSMVFGIIKQSGGEIEVESAPGGGSTFRVYFPQIRTETMAQAEGKDRNMGSPVRGRETVLLVEDEDILLRLGARGLAANGYTVLTAASGGEALAVLERHGKPVDLLITDVVMPVMNGHELAKEVERRKMARRTLYMSGYTDSAIVRHGVLEPGVAFLYKPFSPQLLLGKIREVLDGPADQAKA